MFTRSPIRQPYKHIACVSTVTIENLIFNKKLKFCVFSKQITKQIEILNK